MSALIRRAKEGDERKVAEFAIRLYDQHVANDPERFSTFSNVDGAASFYRSRFDTPDSAVLVAEIENEVVGFAYVERDELNYAALLRDGAWLHDIYVDAPERGKGLGKALIWAAIQAAKQMGADKMLLTVGANNLAAQRIFGDAGFRPTMTEMTLNLPDRS